VSAPAEDSVRHFALDEVEAVRYDDPHIDPYVLLRRVSSSPSIVQVTFPPNARLALHSHPSDTLYVFREGEFHIEGEGAFRPGQVRWVRGGVEYGPEWAGEQGAILLIVALGGPFGTDWTR
jgi:quercetin dioxygenase-like cupin family protein